ncbi:MAG TPA: hypothetical protein VG269_02220 [Tepidisphaeraceae bacterium]|nr:hypothetical protein [Tepidisphaeraceae bacterium]
MLLQTADDAAPLPGVRADLTARVRQRVRGRKRMRAAGSATALVLLAVAATVLVAHGGPGSKVPITQRDNQNRDNQKGEAPVDVPALKEQYARLESEARQHELTAAAMIRMESRARREERIAAAAERAQEVLARPDVLDELAARRDRTARILVDRGDVLLRQTGGAPAAAESYKNVVDLFPDTPEAAVARDRLGRIKA